VVVDTLMVLAVLAVLVHMEMEEQQILVEVAAGMEEVQHMQVVRVSSF
jgi:hypothetical protein